MSDGVGLVGRSARALFAGQFVIAYVALRRSAVVFDPPWVWLGLAASGVLWWSLAGARRPVRGAAVIVAALLTVTQLGFFRFYHVFYGPDAAGAARFMWGDTKPMLLRIAPWLALASVALAATFWLALRRAPVDASRSARAAAPLGATILALTFVLAGGGPPDASAVAGFARFAMPKKSATTQAIVVPTVRPARRPAAVLLILNESIRASDYCDAPGPDCAVAPKTAAATADRVVFHEARAVASYTALSVSALFTGHLPIDGQKVLVESPMVFDLVRSMSYQDGTRPTVHYVSAQTDSFFDRTDLRSVVDTYVTVADLVGHPVDDIDDVIDQGTDRLLADRAETELAKLRPPFLFVAHLGGTHAPYFVDDRTAPFKPYTHATMWSGLDQLHAAYKDAIYTQDESVARIVAAFEKAAGDAPSLVLFTSDHGEAFGEHYAIHHGQDLYDEQIHVPLFAVLERDDRRAALASHEHQYLTHLDVLPTILDMFGTHGSFELHAIESRLLGRSLLGPFEGQGPLLALTNCTDVFPCPVKTYGTMQGPVAFTAQPWDYGWRCVDLHDDQKALDPKSPTCDALGREAKSNFPTLPSGASW